jgi:hypothetical protein
VPHQEQCGCQWADWGEDNNMKKGENDEM